MKVKKQSILLCFLIVCMLSVFMSIQVYAADFNVTIPKTITLDSDKESSYSVKVEGEIASNKMVYVSPVDAIEDTSKLDFYMHDQSTENQKADVEAVVTHNKFYWNSAEVANGVEATNNSVSATELTAGTWKGTFEFVINCQIDTSHIHSYTETITKEPTCLEDGEKTYICDCGDSYIELVPATGHNYIDGVCINCGEVDPDAVEKIKIGDTETRIIAGQTLEFICIDDAYVDASGETKGALFIAKSFVAGNVWLMGGQTQSSFVNDWASNSVRVQLNGDTSDLTDLVSVNTTITKAYSSTKTTKNYDVGDISIYGTAIDYSAATTEDKVFVLSLEEAVKYNKVTIDGQEISVMWDLNCDGTIEFKSYSTGKYGYYLRTPASGTKKAMYTVWYTGAILTGYNRNIGVRPCYVKYNGHYHKYVETVIKEPTCTEDGEKVYTCDCGASYTEVIPATGHKYAESVITKKPTCTEDGEKTYTCDVCGGNFTETIPATGHNYVDGICTECGDEKIVVGDRETRVIAGQTLEFICIDDAYVDASGEVKGALFIAYDFISIWQMKMGASTSNEFVRDWAYNDVRGILNGDTSDLTDLVSVDTTVTTSYAYSESESYVFNDISYYGKANAYNAPKTEDKVFILSLEEAIKYAKVDIGEKTYSALWDMDCDGNLDFYKFVGKVSTPITGAGYYLRTPVSGENNELFTITWDGKIGHNYHSGIGTRPCYVKDIKSHRHHYEEGICIGCGEEQVLAPGLYDENNVRLITYSQLISSPYDMKIEKNYTKEESYQSEYSPYYVIHNKLGIDTACKLIMNDCDARIGSYAFYGQQLIELGVGNSVTSIGDYAFYKNPMEKLIISDSVTSIGQYAFDKCTNLKKVKLGNGITSIGTYAFSGCKNLTSLNIPDSTTAIGYGAFSLCTNLTSVTLGNNLITIGNFAFSETNVENMVIPDTVISIGADAFLDCKNLGNIVIGDNVKSIGKEAFAGCTKLETIYIPASVTYMPVSSYYSQFYNCSPTLKIYCGANEKQDGWGTYWNYYASKKELSTTYGVTREEYENLLISETDLLQINEISDSEISNNAITDIEQNKSTSNNEDAIVNDDILIETEDIIDEFQSQESIEEVLVTEDEENSTNIETNLVEDETTESTDNTEILESTENIEDIDTLEEVSLQENNTVLENKNVESNN